jgi:hydroxymethylpyrimidine pyrophosphatase-like HAD family hydrolase
MKVRSVNTRTRRAELCLERKATRRVQVALTARDQPQLLCDLDGTLIESEPIKWTDGTVRAIHPDAVAALRRLREHGVRIGVVTERPALSCASWLRAVSHLAGYDDDDLFDGLIIAEGGGIVRRPAGDGHPPRWRRCASGRAMAVRAQAGDCLNSAIMPLPQSDGWGLLQGLDPTIGTLVRWPDNDEVCELSLCLYERGPSLADDPQFATRYAAVAMHVEGLLYRAGITGLALTETGNGTLRIGPRNVDKGRVLALLAHLGRLDLARTVFVGDGLNDVPLARRLQALGGAVVAVANAVPELQRLADWVAPAPAGRGVAQLVELVLHAGRDTS